MGKSRFGWSTGFTVALVVGLLLACNGIRNDEFACEDAVSHLQQCCPGFTGSNVSCTYDSYSGCSSGASFPDFTVDQSACVRSETCALLQSSGVCERALAIVANSGESGGYQDPSSASTVDVCP
jgi:hypothetical protein